MSESPVYRWCRGSAVAAMIFSGVIGSTRVGTASPSEPPSPEATGPATSVAPPGDLAEAERAEAERAEAECAEAAMTTDESTLECGASGMATAGQGEGRGRSTLRRIRTSELNPTLIAKAAELVRRYHSEPFGTEIAFSLNGRDYVGRIERHYHPEGGARRPWGFHPGCSLLVIEPVG